MKQKFCDYNIGFDVGTSSVGWAATDFYYNLLRFNGKDMWGTRLYEEAETAEQRRLHRTSRRRYKRVKNRIKLLQELFSEVISKVDPVFYERLKESKYHLEDRKNSGGYTLFNDKDFTDKDYFNKYPTIFHLRKELIHDKSKKDIRLIYLAIHNILKKRGHFLFEGQDIKSVKELRPQFEKVCIYFYDNFNIDLDVEKVKEVENILTDKNNSASQKVSKLKRLFDTKDVQVDAAFKIMVGNKGQLEKLYADEQYKESEKKDIKFQDINYEEVRTEYAEVLNEKIDLLDILKSIYDWMVLSDILGSSETLSDSMVENYERHKEELEVIKYLFKKYLSKSDYYKFFRSTDKDGIYSSYIGYSSNKGKKTYTDKKNNDQLILCKELKKYLLKMKVSEKDMLAYEKILSSAEKGEALPKQRTSANGVIPYQVHKMELVRILDNAAKHYPELNEKDSEGLSISEKIISLMEFRIPYYVGPLNNYHSEDNGRDGNSWVVRKEAGRVLPWNFEEKIDIAKSAEKFITRMTNKCSYLIGEDVLPKDSILYSKYKALNEINNIKIDGVPISVELKQEIFEELIKTEKRITSRKLRDFLKIKKIENAEKCAITGIDGDIKSSMRSYIDFKRIFGDKIDHKPYIDIAEDSIRWKCLYGEDKKLFRRKLREEYGEYLADKDIKAISKLNFKEWGRLSKKLLNEIQVMEESTGVVYDSIIDALYETNDNLMELMSFKYNLTNSIEEINDKIQQDEDLSLDDFMDELYLSPSVRRAINQTVKISEEIRRITGKDPKKIFIEMARGPEEIKKRKDSRKDQLLAIYKDKGLNDPTLLEQLNSFDNARLRQRKLYLYFTQLGKCMYSGETIKLRELLSENIYDIDHIHPQSKVKDDSLDNIILVRKDLNAFKSDSYPIDSEIRKNMYIFWKSLKDKKLISDKKFERLTRSSSFTDEELVSFIARQIVETRQSTKAIGLIFQKMYPSSEIVYVKAGLVSDFRHKFDIIKVREMNNFHHAHDAYLTTVVGNAYDTKFTKNPMNFIKSAKKDSNRKYNLKRLFEFDIERTGIKAWDKERSIATVKKVIARPTVLVTERTFDQSGELFDATIQKKKDKYNNMVLPLKSELSDTSKYGAYNSIKGKYFFLVEHEDKKGKKIKTLETLPLYAANNINCKKDLEEFSADTLNLKNPKIIIDRIPYRTKIEWNGFPYLITGKTGNRFILKCSKELTLDKASSLVLKDVSDYYSRDEDLRYVKKRSNNESQEKAESRFNDELVDLYKLFIKRLDENGPYEKRANNSAEVIASGLEKFKELNVDDKCKVILEVNKIFSRIPGATADLLLVGGKKTSSKPLISKNFTDSNIFIINDSITGLFSKRKKL